VREFVERALVDDWRGTGGGGADGWGVSRIGWDFSFIYLGDGDRAAYIPAVFIPTAHAVSLAITTVSMLVLWRWSSRTGTYFRVGKPTWNWIDAAFLAVLVVLLGVMFLLVMNWGPPPFRILSPIF